MITQVVASERVEAQTNYVAMHSWGCRTAIVREVNELEERWKAPP